MNDNSQSINLPISDNSSSKNQSKAFISLLPIFAFIKPYKLMLGLALFALLMTAAVNLSLGQGVKFVIDNGFIAGSVEQLQLAILVLIGLISPVSYTHLTLPTKRIV